MSHGGLLVDTFTSLPEIHRHGGPSAYVRTMIGDTVLSWLHSPYILWRLLLWYEDSLSLFLVAIAPYWVNELLRVPHFGIK